MSGKWHVACGKLAGHEYGIVPGMLMWHVYERTLKNQRFLSLQNQINYRQNQLRSPRREQLAAGGVRGREERRVSLGRQLFSQQVEVEMGEDMTRPPPGGFLLLFHATTREMHPSQ